MIALIVCALFFAVSPRAYQKEVTTNEIFLMWKKSEVPFYIARHGTPLFSHVALKKAVEHSFSVWNKIGCDAPKLAFVSFTDEPQASLNGKNSIIFRNDSWDPEVSGALALSTISAVVGTGEIFSADIEFNAKEFVFSIPGAGTAALHDFENTLIHELGHVLGLDHPEMGGYGEQSFSTMYGSAPVGELIKRSLDTDDIIGLCAIYAADKTGDAYEANAQTAESSGCNIMPKR
ncbi:MAG: hypothetical protein Kow0090_13460 [Myxococcota bacterium]